MTPMFIGTNRLDFFEPIDGPRREPLRGRALTDEERSVEGQRMLPPTERVAA